MGQGHRRKLNLGEGGHRFAGTSLMISGGSSKIVELDGDENFGVEKNIENSSLLAHLLLLMEKFANFLYVSVLFFIFLSIYLPPWNFRGKTSPCLPPPPPGAAPPMLMRSGEAPPHSRRNEEYDAPLDIKGDRKVVSGQDFFLWP